MQLMGRLSCLAAVLLVACFSAQADVSHRVNFSVGPQIIVWTSTGEIHQGETVLLGMDGRALGNPAATNQRVLAGTLVPVSTSPTVPTRMQVRVATNTSFEIKVLSEDTTAWRAQVKLLAAGSKANTAGLRLNQEVEIGPDRPNTVLVSAPNRTAALRGAPADQALGFEISLTPLHSDTGGQAPRIFFAPQR
ncbi:MAG: hypothetical protein AAF829_06135 [Pseudomonadota bacterium]